MPSPGLLVEFVDVLIWLMEVVDLPLVFIPRRAVPWEPW